MFFLWSSFLLNVQNRFFFSMISSEAESRDVFSKKKNNIDLEQKDLCLDINIKKMEEQSLRRSRYTQGINKTALIRPLYKSTFQVDNRPYYIPMNDLDFEKITKRIQFKHIVLYATDMNSIDQIFIDHAAYLQPLVIVNTTTTPKNCAMYDLVQPGDAIKVFKGIVCRRLPARASSDQRLQFSLYKDEALRF
jgi:hypothetical protein